MHGLPNVLSLCFLPSLTEPLIGETKEQGLVCATWILWLVIVQHQGGYSRASWVQFCDDTCTVLLYYSLAR